MSIQLRGVVSIGLVCALQTTTLLKKTYSTVSKSYFKCASRPKSLPQVCYLPQRLDPLDTTFYLVCPTAPMTFSGLHSRACNVRNTRPEAAFLLR